MKLVSEYHLGKNMKHALSFARKYSGWHSFYVRQRETRMAIYALRKRGLVEVNQYNQFRGI